MHRLFSTWAYVGQGNLNQDCLPVYNYTHLKLHPPSPSITIVCFKPVVDLLSKSHLLSAKPPNLAIKPG
jgi:hypothetical protein